MEFTLRASLPYGDAKWYGSPRPWGIFGPMGVRNLARYQTLTDLPALEPNNTLGCSKVLGYGNAIRLFLSVSPRVSESLDTTVPQGKRPITEDCKPVY